MYIYILYDIIYRDFIVLGIAFGGTWVLDLLAQWALSTCGAQLQASSFSSIVFDSLGSLPHSEAIVMIIVWTSGHILVITRGSSCQPTHATVVQWSLGAVPLVNDFTSGPRLRIHFVTGN